MSPEKHRKTTGQWSGLCSSCKVVWETLGPRWEVSSREVGKQKERKRSERHSPFISLLGRGKWYSTMSFSPHRQKTQKWEVEGRNEEETRNNGWKMWEDTVQHLLCNYQLSNYHYNEEVTVSVVTWTTILIGSFNLMRAITRTDRGERLASGSRLVSAQLNYKHEALERARRNMQIYLNTTGWKHRRVRSVPLYLIIFNRQLDFCVKYINHCSFSASFFFVSSIESNQSNADTDESAVAHSWKGCNLLMLTIH